MSAMVLKRLFQPNMWFRKHSSAQQNVSDSLIEHYNHSGLLMDKISTGISNTKSIAADAVSAQDLHPIDQFHIGGTSAIDELINRLSLADTSNVLDIGCGLGGVSRHIAINVPGCTVHGIDLTPEYVDVSKRLSALVGVSNTTFAVGSATDLPVTDNSYDVAALVHVGMNVQDKLQLFREAYRVLKPGGRFGVFDIMFETKDRGDLKFPLPWSSEQATSFVDTPSVYHSAAEQAGFMLESIRNRGEFARQWKSATLEKMEANKSKPMPPLSLITVLGPTGLEKFHNSANAILNKRILTTVEMVFCKPHSSAPTCS